ncbi:single-strand DNA-binding protein [Motilibacter rhizosphaerae]|uniref:Single-stranded DNA-binding protein n=1 Tax=Motilibacter rhizosphaerae TaxID=598652 RepID=A0A4Q7NSB1_9ACTN|nr:single-stranded DNA-binding protein [Motilibacter rhizosphaerae]RZS89834.1 single-strand DNA-binding protein [Motilibacter rhizosphaerae]
MNDAYVTLVGNLTSDCRHGETEEGVPRTNFGLAHTPRRRLRDGSWADGDTTFYSVTCWRDLAVNAANSLRKGDPVVVRGTLRSREWTSGERSGTALELSADTVGHDLSRGSTHFRRAERKERTAEPEAVAALPVETIDAAEAADAVGGLRGGTHQGELVGAAAAGG